MSRKVRLSKDPERQVPGEDAQRSGRSAGFLGGLLRRGSVVEEPAESVEIASPLQAFDDLIPRDTGGVGEWNALHRLDSLRGRPGRWQSYLSKWLPVDSGWIRVSAERRGGEVHSSVILGSKPSPEASGITIGTVTDENNTLLRLSVSSALANGQNGVAFYDLTRTPQPELDEGSAHNLAITTKALGQAWSTNDPREYVHNS